MQEVKYHIYAQQKEVPRSVMTEEELAALDLYHTRRSFDTKLELDEWKDLNVIKTSSGQAEIMDNGKHKVVTFHEGYSSVFYYDKDELETHLSVNEGSVKGYKGKCYTDWFYMDLDYKSNAKELPRLVEPFIRYLDENNIRYLIYFSGNQGIHLYIPIAYLEVPNELQDKANLVCITFLEQLIKQFPTLKDIADPQVYAINTIFRMPVSRNPKSGLIKTMMEKKDDKLVKIPYESNILKMSYQSVIKPVIDVTIKPHWKLDESLLNVKEPTELKFETYFPCPYGQKACIYKLLNAHLAKGEHRHEAGMRLMSWLKNDMEFPNQFVWAYLQEWNKTLKDEMSLQELKNTYKYIDSYAYNLCADPFMDRFCTHSNACQFWYGKSSVAKGSSVIDSLKEYDNFAHDKEVIDFGKIFTGMRLKAKPAKGFILPIIAGSKVGKTTLALNIALRAKVPTVIFSYEVSKVGLISFFAKMLGLDIDNATQRSRLIEEIKHIFIIDEGRPALQSLPKEVEAIEKKHKVKIKMIILDYFQLIPVWEENTTKLIDNPVRRADVISALLPDIVKKNGWLTIIPTQPTKDVEGGGSTILLQDAGKGGQAIQAMGDALMTAWRPYKNDNPLVESDNDNVMSLWVCANRWGKEDIIRNYNYYGEKKLVEGVYAKQVEHKEAIHFKPKQ